MRLLRVIVQSKYQAENSGGTVQEHVSRNLIEVCSKTPKFK